jgi:hypothetical protein
MAHEGVPLVAIQRQLGHANLGITSIYLQGIDSSEIAGRGPPGACRSCFSDSAGPLPPSYTASRSGD